MNGMSPKYRVIKIKTKEKDKTHIHPNEFLYSKRCMDGLIKEKKWTFLNIYGE